MHAKPGPASQLATRTRAFCREFLLCGSFGTQTAVPPGAARGDLIRAISSMLRPMSDLFHECGIAAVYQLPGAVSDLLPRSDASSAASLIPRLLVEIQNRGQLAAGMTSFNAGRNQLIDTHKDLGRVDEVFRTRDATERRRIMEEYSGPAAIGHVRYATCGKDDRSYAQPFERHHIETRKWFSFAFNGQLANYHTLRSELTSQGGFHLARETDTEIVMHLLSQELSRQAAAGSELDYELMLRNVANRFEGAYNLVFLNALGHLVIARDPLGLRPLCYASDGRLFAAASESVALSNIGFPDHQIHDLQPGTAIVIDGDLPREVQFAESPRRAHCFFEWIYFANVASVLDEQSVYLTRKRLGEALAAQETVPIDDDTIVVPVPDTAKAAADAMAYALRRPSLEGLIRNRYVGRTFIESSDRAAKVRQKFTPLREVMEGKRVLLVEDSIVRSTTLRTLIGEIRERGRCRELHVRVACPPIVAPCFYGIDMASVDELFAPQFLENGQLTPAAEQAMADELGADTLRYLPTAAIAEAIGKPATQLCQACLDGTYPTPTGQHLYQLSRSSGGGRPVEGPIATVRG